MSEGRWRQIVNGYQVVTKGVYHSTAGAPADTIARMAQVVYIEPEALEEVGRADAAEELRKLNRSSPGADRAADDLDQRIARLKVDPRKRRRLEQIVEIIEDCN